VVAGKEREMNQTYDEHIERMLDREREAARKAQAARKAGSPEIEVECWRAAREWCERRLALREACGLRAFGGIARAEEVSDVGRTRQ
jgi:hypothetical protein